MCKIRELLFVNKDAKPRSVLLHVGTSSIAPVMAWYSAYFAGDRYKVFVDGKGVQMDRNGELVGNPPAERK